ncbi:MAG TPA: FAD-binding and (Fe-S)-binding domain-containing protein [Devosiaceae bacterium]
MQRASAAARIVERLEGVIRPDRLMTDPLYTYAYSGDASFYRLVPALVAIVNTEAEVQALLVAARAEGLPVTFRAAGTSLSGQAVTDGVLAVLGDGWRKIEISADGHRITLGPSIIVAQANRALKAHNRRIGPDPASQASCKIGGVVANNSSGMCCGVAQNTYHTMHRLRMMTSDGQVLDSGDPQSRAAFAAARPDLVDGLSALRAKVRGDNELVDLIRRKYAIKNTVGYSLNALVDHDDPIDILTHLMVGSEGTLGFVSEITYDTVPDHPFKATAVVPYATSHKALQGVQALAAVGVSAAEFMERRALATVEDKPAMASIVPSLTDSSPAVLVEIMGADAEGLEAEIEKATSAMQAVGPLSPVQFTRDAELQAALWDIRKGLFASAGATREQGTIMLTEDVAVPIDRLADVADDLRTLLDDCGYPDAIIFGHALAGNLHFQMAENFTRPGALQKFDRFMRELGELVSIRYKGSLKAEHGTGRAIAAFVEAEWGPRAYQLMREIKALIEPENLLNPGVLLNDDKEIHLKNLKSMTAADEIVDMCIECGFCEKVCPSAGFTLTPRQRIAVTRETARLAASGEDPAMLQALEDGFEHAGLDTCAACNLCSTVCPVGIETGTMVLGKRAGERRGLSHSIAGMIAANTGLVESAMSAAVGAQHVARRVIGDGVVEGIAAAARTLTGDRLPRPSRGLRPGPGAPRPVPPTGEAPLGKVVYFPSCAARMFGSDRTEFDLLPVPEAMMALLARAGYAPVMPQHLHGMCCGQPFKSKGFPEEARKVGSRLADALREAGSESCSVVTDASTCALHMRGAEDMPPASDSVEFLLDAVLPHLTIERRLPVVAVHHNCSAQRLREQPRTEALAAACADDVAVLTSITCCGFAGDKGLFEPELNAHALRFVRADVPQGCKVGVTTVSTCATGLTEHAGIPFVGLASLLEWASRP